MVALGPYADCGREGAMPFLVDYADLEPERRVGRQMIEGHAHSAVLVFHGSVLVLKQHSVVMVIEC